MKMPLDLRIKEGLGRIGFAKCATTKEGAHSDPELERVRALANATLGADYEKIAIVRRGCVIHALIIEPGYGFSCFVLAEPKGDYHDKDDC